MHFNSLSDFHTSYETENTQIYLTRLDSNLFLELSITNIPDFPFVVSILNAAYKPLISHWDDHVFDETSNAFSDLNEALTYANELSSYWSDTTHARPHGPKFF